MTSSQFKEILLPLHARLYRVAYRILGNQADAEDIVQEGYLKLWENRDQLQEINSLEAYCCMLVRNLSLDKLRQTSSKGSFASIEDHEVDVAESMPDETLEKEEQRMQLQKMVEALPQQQKDLIRMWHYEECSMQEIQQDTGLSLVNIRKILSRARKKLHDQLLKFSCHDIR